MGSPEELAQRCGKFLQICAARDTAAGIVSRLDECRNYLTNNELMPTNDRLVDSLPRRHTRCLRRHY
jgi:hypothetical protein